MPSFYGAIALTGGAAGALDDVDGTGLNDGDGAIVKIPTSGEVYEYTLDADSGATESSPNVIAPDANAGNKRWLLCPADSNKHYVNPSAADQGASTHKSIKALVDAIGATKKATLVLAHNGVADETTYTVTTSETIPDNITLDPEPGAIIDGAGTLTIAGKLNAGRNQIFGSSITVEFSDNSLQDFAYPEWWGENTTPGTTDMTAEIQAAITALEANLTGGTVYPGYGDYLVSATINLDRSSDDTKGLISIKGKGVNNTNIEYTGSGACFSIKNSHTGSGEPNASYQVIEDMSISGSSTAGTYGVYVNLGAFINLKYLHIQAFDYGIYLEDVDQSYFERLYIRFNTYGFFARKEPANDAKSTCPNNLTFIACHISNNYTYGALFQKASNVNFIGGAIEANGRTTPGWGLKVEEAGYQGDIGLNCNGVYFEGNEGQADVMLANTAVDFIKNVVHSFVACGFKRISSAYYTTNNIYADFDSVATVGLHTVNVINCGFNGYNTYAADAGRPYINFLNGITQDNFVNFGNIFESAVETPATNIRWNTIAIDAGDGSTATTASIADMPALYQIDIDSLSQSGRINLPAASTCVGYEIIVYLTNSHATYSFIVDVNGTDQIIGTSAAGDNIYSQTADAFVHLIALASGKWGILNADGATALPATWTET